MPCITAEFCSPIGNRKRFIRVELFKCIENSSNLTRWKVTKGRGGGGGGGVNTFSTSARRARRRKTVSRLPSWWSFALSHQLQIMDKMTRPYSLNSRVGLNVNVPNSVSSLRLNSAAKSSRGNSSQASHSKIAAQATCWKRETEHRLSFIREPIPRLSSITGRYADTAFLSLLPSISHSDWWPRIRGRNSKLAWHASINHWPIVGQGKWPALTRQHAQAWGHTVNGLYAHVGQNWKASLATSSSKICFARNSLPRFVCQYHTVLQTRGLITLKQKFNWTYTSEMNTERRSHGYSLLFSITVICRWLQ